MSQTSAWSLHPSLKRTGATDQVDIAELSEPELVQCLGALVKAERGKSLVTVLHHLAQPTEDPQVNWVLLT